MVEKDIVAGGIGFTGRYIVRRLLLDKNRKIIALTSHINRKHEFGNRIKVRSYNFDNYKTLLKTLEGTTCVFNTYWVRFNYKNVSFKDATKNSKLLVDASIEAGVERFIHISVINPSQNYHYEYFRGKREVEKYIKKSGLSYAILRPALLFGNEEILLNNITWLIRKYGIFFIFGSGKYKVTPVYVDDVANEAVKQAKLKKNIVEDAIGPETYEFEELVRSIAKTINKPLNVYHLNNVLITLVSKFLSFTVNDPIVTADEMKVVLDNTLYSNAKPIGTTKFSKWLEQHKTTFGTEYHSEVERHFKY